MNYLEYQEKINNIIEKAPIEAGIEILVYNFLEEFLKFNDEYVLVSINRMQKKSDSRFTTEGGISDLAIVSKDFKYNEAQCGKVYAFVEVKTAGESLNNNSNQVEGQIESIKHLFYTNGFVWEYYHNQERQWKINIMDEEYDYSIAKAHINKDKYLELVYELLDAIKGLSI